MKEYFMRLNSMERRFVVGVMLIVFVLLNWVFVWPRFSDWSKYLVRRQKADDTLVKFQQAIAQGDKIKPFVSKLEGEGMSVPPEDMTVNFMLTIQSQGAASGVSILSNSRMPERADQFFMERVQNLSVTAGESELVDFLYNLGAGNSLIRVRGLSLHPDAPRQKLTGNITLVASYQKKAPPRPAPPAPAPVAKPADKPAAEKPAAEKPKPAAAERPKSRPAPIATNAPPSSGVPKPLTPTKK